MFYGDFELKWNSDRRVFMLHCLNLSVKRFIHKKHKYWFEFHGNVVVGVMEKNISPLMLILIIGAFLLAFSVPLSAEREASTILSSQRTFETITADGYANESSWNDVKVLVAPVIDGSIGKVDINLRSLFDDEYIYFFITWDDPTKSVYKKQWTFNGTDWVRSEDEDRFAIFWNINDSIAGFNIAGCAMLCHGDRMQTNAPEEKADSWHWKAARTNPAGYVDDKFVGDVAIDYAGGPIGTLTEVTGRQSDSKESGGYKDNIIEDKTRPKYYEHKPKDSVDEMFIFSNEVEDGQAVEITDEMVFSKGDTVPGYILEKPVGSRGDIEARGVWKDGQWNLEIKRKLVTGNDDDVQFDVTKIYRFGVAVMDNTGGFLKFGEGHSYDLGARTLEFGGIGLEEVSTLSLVKSYLQTAETYVKADDHGLAISAVSDSLLVYNSVSGLLSNLDPSLHISIMRGFVDVRRLPTLENIDAQIKNIDDAMLTLQGKRAPKEPSLGLIILSVWGRVQLYVFVSLSIIVLYPFYKTIQTLKTKELNYFGVFLLIVMAPIFLQGLGSLGILIDNKFLQAFSITTNEYVTMLWALAVYVALLIAGSGFKQVENTITTLRTQKEDLDDSNRLKDIFTDIMRHDLLNPIGLIGSYVDLLRDEKLEPTVKEYIDVISNSADKASEMIESASMLGKLEKEETLDLSRLDLGKILKRAVSDFKIKADHKKIKLELSLKDEYPANVNNVIYDVFSNLISNAIKYSPEGSTITTGITDEGENWRIFVEDQGEGVPDEYKKDVFDRFKRIHKGGVEGTGLGLTIVNKILDLHKGRVWVKDNPGGGSIFLIEIPKDLTL